MTQELLYTSAPKGLKPGSRGFCTVVSTQGMPAPLVTALESLSAYRQVFPHGHARSSDNPVNWSHVLMSAGGRPVHVLSRISDYGLDYTQRSNKLAHHLVLSEGECPPPGPAWVLQQPGVAQGEWDGTVRTLPQGRAIPSGRTTSLRAGAWEEATGDAGWAGVVADALVADPHRQIFLIFSPGQDLLPLVAEVIALLPESLRWGITFSTYATQLPPNATCQWRCHLADSPEAQQSLRFVKALRVDLTKSLGMAPGGPLVETARTGRSAPPLPTHAATPLPLASPPDIEFTEAVAALPPARHESTAQPPSSTYRLVRSLDSPVIRTAPPPMRRPARSRSMPIGLIGFMVAVFLVVLATIGSVLFTRNQPHQGLPSSQMVANEGEAPQLPPRPDPPEEVVAAEAEPEQNDASKSPVPGQEKEDNSPKEGAVAEPSMTPENVGGIESAPAANVGEAPPMVMHAQVATSEPFNIPRVRFLPGPLTKDDSNDVLVLESSSSGISLLTPELLSKSWITQNEDNRCTLRNQHNLALAKLKWTPSLGGRALYVESGFVTNPELSWCGIYLDKEAPEIVLLRESYSYELRLPAILKIRDGWLANAQGSGVPRIHVSAPCEIQAGEKRIRFSLSELTIADPTDIRSGEAIAEGVLAESSLMEDTWQLGAEQHSTSKSQGRVKVVIQMAPNGLRIALQPKVTDVVERHKADAYTTYRKYIANNPNVPTPQWCVGLDRKAVSFADAADRLASLIQKAGNSLKSNGMKVGDPRQGLLECLQQASMQLSAAEQMEDDLSSAKVVKLRIYYHLTTKNVIKGEELLINGGKPFEVDIINIDS